jgi:hypothetical protein
MSEKVREIELKRGMPRVEEARARLLLEMDRAATAGVVALKIIHGYGSSGVGGKLRTAIRNSLRKRRKEGRIRAFVPGEQWAVFDDGARELLDACPELDRDADLGRYNEGVTFVLL